LLERILPTIAKSDLVVFADFNYGILTQDVVDAISAECRRRKVMMVADSQSSSQTGDVSRFKGVALITPTEREARIALANYEDGLVVVANRLRRKANADHVIVTLGAEGLLVHAKATKRKQWHTDRLEALNTAPQDPAGAGDCLLVCASMALALGRPIWESAYLGSLAAACQVGRIGNLPLTADELRIEIGKGRPLREV
jgi:bifunctional ADP-heptose synthase (sugar kinase/adenylyltransferase)